MSNNNYYNDNKKRNQQQTHAPTNNKRLWRLIEQNDWYRTTNIESFVWQHFKFVHLVVVLLLFVFIIMMLLPLMWVVVVIVVVSIIWFIGLYYVKVHVHLTWFVVQFAEFLSTHALTIYWMKWERERESETQRNILKREICIWKIAQKQRE